MYFSCCNRVFRATRLGCRRLRVQIKVESAGDLKILCILSSKWYLFRIRDGYSSERRGWALLFTCCAQESVGFSTYTDPTVVRLQEIFIFYASLHDLAMIEYRNLKISNAQELIQPDSVLLPQKEKVHETHTVHTRCIHKIFFSTLEQQGKQKVTGAGRGKQTRGLGAWCRGRWLGGLNYFAKQKKIKWFYCHASV